MKPTRRPTLKPTVNLPTFVAVLATGVCAVLAANAQVSSSLAISTTTVGSMGAALTEALAGPEISTTAIPLGNSFQPSTPWPPVTTISQTALTAPHDLLSYTGVESAARELMGADFPVWRSHFGEKTETDVLPQGMLMSSGCLNPCDTQKSLLIIDPATQKAYGAMVTAGKVAMWPSLMSWPDDSIPALKRWLAAATDDK